MSEFELSVTTTVPTQFLRIAPPPDEQFLPSSALGIAPVNIKTANSTVPNVASAGMRRHQEAITSGIKPGPAGRPPGLVPPLSNRT